MIVLLASALLALQPIDSHPRPAPQPTVTTISPDAAELVVFTLDGGLKGEANGPAEDLLDFLQQASSESSLTTIQVAGDRLRMSFSFPTELKFRMWYTSTSAQRLVDQLKKLTTSVAYSVQLDRTPHLE